MIRSLQEEQKDETSPSIDGVCLLGSAETLSASKSLFYLPTFVLELLQPMLSSGFADLAFSPKSDPAVKHKALAYSGQNAMHVCKSFYMNFEWATADDWTALSTLPTLLISGEDDKLTPVEKAQSLFANFLQGKESRATIEVVTCAGHQVMQEQPQKVIEILETFMQPLEIMP
jgi:pimeloyl-ACP methyl ester carboxylesterase